MKFFESLKQIYKYKNDLSTNGKDNITFNETSTQYKVKVCD